MSRNRNSNHLIVSNMSTRALMNKKIITLVNQYFHFGSRPTQLRISD